MSLLTMARSNRWKKKLFCPLPCSAAGHVGIGQPIQIVNKPYVTVIIRHNCRLYRIPVFIAIIAFSAWIVNVCQEAHISLVLPHHSHQVTLVLTRMSPHFYLSVWGLRSLGMPFLCSLTVPNRKFSSGPSRHIGQGREKSPCTVYGQILLHPLSD